MIAALSRIALAVLIALAPTVSSAKTFKWTAASDVLSWDPHSQNAGLQNGIHAAVYESLVYYNSRTFEVEPMLARQWQQITPTHLRLSLRTGVKFHDGRPFTADDAVFSIQRAMKPNSTFQPFTQGIARVVKIDDLRLDIHTSTPNPVLLNQLTELRILSESWAKEHDSTNPKDVKSKTENYAHRHANGTGPFMLKEWIPNRDITLTRNPAWWGPLESNVTEIIFSPLPSLTSRIAALESGSIDLVLDPTPQSLLALRNNSDFKLLNGPENRTLFIGMDHFSDQLQGSNIKGKNPLKDRRVRKALYTAIDTAAITRVTLRGQGQVTGALVMPKVNGWSEALNKRPEFSVSNAKALLSEAGFANGFELELSCPNNRYPNDEEICQAIKAMWERIGVKAKLTTYPFTDYFPRLQRHELGVYLIGFGPATFDGLNTLQSLVQTRTRNSGDGNFGRYSNPAIDSLINRIKKEADPKVRTGLITEALQLQNDDVATIPLINLIIPWAMRSNVNIVHRPDNRIDWRILQLN
ncbi:MAG: ABC transporter substrate-binding protein [Rhodoferax sp.]|uniref:ABC transporter substrate-binding protein n=1 Tax=Rhodoferax sp. TaxID=50421 RepID=UPI002ACE6446|nr:ABC transporter substrate-binding protein [Rhodoferax sp.]MDZ7892502.1 ABC transporter substrate-binding protein [Rhodoferax sp.]